MSVFSCAGFLLGSTPLFILLNFKYVMSAPEGRFIRFTVAFLPFSECGLLVGAFEMKFFLIFLADEEFPGIFNSDRFYPFSIRGLFSLFFPLVQLRRC